MPMGVGAPCPVEDLVQFYTSPYLSFPRGFSQDPVVVGMAQPYLCLYWV